LTIRQDASLTDTTSLPSPTTQFVSNVLPTNYTIQSDQGTLTFNSSALFAGANSFTASATVGGIVLNGANSAAVTTTGSQTYLGTLTLTQNTTLASNSSGAISLQSASGAYGLTLTSTVGKTISGTIGSPVPLASLTIASSGTATLSGSIATTGQVSFASPVTLAGNESINSNNNAIAFASVVNGNFNLSVNSGTSTSVFASTIGATTNLQSFTDLATGTTTFSAGTITTNAAGGIVLNGPITLGGTAVLTSNGNPITLGGPINGAFPLTIAPGTGTVSVNAPFGAVTPLSAFTTTGAGTISFNGGTINTTGNVTLTTTNLLLGSNLAITQSAATSNLTLGTTNTHISASTNTLSLSAVTGGSQTVNAGVVASLGAFSLQSATGGAGTISFGSGVTIDASTQSYLSGTGNGTTATLDVRTNSPSFSYSAGTNSFSSFVIGQDAAVTDTSFVPALTQFGGTAPSNYTIQSNNSTLAIDNGSLYNGAGTLTLWSGALTGAVGDNLSFGPGVTISAPTQIYRAGTGSGNFVSDSIDDLTNSPNFGTPTNLTIRQDASLSDTRLPAFSTLPANYTIESDGGTLTLDSPSLFAAANFTAATTTGTILLNLSSTLTNTGNQVYTANGGKGVVELGQNATLSSSGGNITLAAAIDGPYLLTTPSQFTGTLSIQNQIGTQTAPLTGLNLSAGSIKLSGGVITTAAGGSQTYNTPVVLVDSTQFNANSGTVTFRSTLDGGTANADSATVVSSGIISFANNVGATTPLVGLTLPFDSGGSAIITANVTTNGPQVYGNPVTTGAATTLAAGSGSISFNSAVNGTSSSSALTINTTGTSTLTLGGPVGQIALGTLTVNSPRAILTGGSFSTTGATSFAGAVTLGANATFASGSGLSFGSTVDGAFALSSSAPTTFGGAVGSTTALSSVTTTSSGTTSLGNVTTTGSQTYDDATVSLNGGLSISLSSGKFTLPNAAVIQGPSTITALGGGTLGSINGSNSLNVNTRGTIVFNGAVGATTPLTSFTTGGLGTDTFSSGTINASGNVVIGASNTNFLANTTITASTGTLSLAGAIRAGANAISASAGSSDTVAATVTAGAFSVQAASTGSGSLTFNSGATILANTQTYWAGRGSGATAYVDALTGDPEFLNSAGTGAPTSFTIRQDAPISDTPAGALPGLPFYSQFGTVGPTNFFLESDGGGITFNSSTLFKGSNVTATLASGNTFTASTVTLSIPSLTVTSPGAFTVAGQLTVPTFTAAAATGGSGTLNFAASTTINADSQSYVAGNGSGTATADLLSNSPTFLNKSGKSAPVSFALTQDGSITDSSTPNFSVVPATYSLQSNRGNVTLATASKFANSNLTVTATTGTASIAAALSINSLAVIAPTITLGTGSIVSLVGQSYSGPNNTAGATSLTANTVLTANSGNVAFAGTVDGNFALTINDPGTTILGGNVGGVTPLNSFMSSFTGNTLLGGNLVTNGSSGQTFNNPVLLTGTSTLQAGTAPINFTTTIDGASPGTALSIASASLTTFSGAVGGNDPLGSLSVANTVSLGAPISTTGAQLYSGAATLADAVTLASTTGNIAFGKTIDGANSLVVNSTSGQFQATGAIGSVTPLAGLSITAGSGIAINGGSVMTNNGPQFFNGDVILGTSTSSTTTFSAGTGSVSFAPSSGDALDGAANLVVNSTATEAFLGPVGSVTPLLSITTDAPGSVILGSSIRTNGNQTYNDAATITGTATLNAGPGNISFPNTINGTGTLILNTAGTATLGGTTTMLGSLSIASGGATVLSGSTIATSSGASFGSPVTLDSDISLSTTGGTLVFGNSVNGAQNLSVTNTGGLATTFLGNVGATAPLTSLVTHGTTDTLSLQSVTTTGTQSYSDPNIKLNGTYTITGTSPFSSSGSATLTGSTTVSTGSGGSTLNQVNGNYPLSVTTPGTATFNGVIGGTTPLASLTVNNAATTSINQNITTYGPQTYQNLVTAAKGVVLTSLNSTVTAPNHAPVLTPIAPSLTTIPANATSNTGQTVASFVGTSITDADPDAVQGIALTGDTATNGTWQYSINAGSTWTNMPAVSATSALLLRSQDLVRFVPDGHDPDSPTLTYRAWDQTTGTVGTLANPTSNGGETAYSTATDTANLSVTLVNIAPSFTAGSNQTVLENPGTQTVANWATNISDGPPDQAGFTLNFIVSAANPTMFAVQPAVSASGTLTYTPALDVTGTTTISVAIHNNGGTANGGVDTSAVQTFTITVTPVTQPPTFVAGPNVTVLANSGPQVVAGWATAISAGPPLQAGETLTFIVSADSNTPLFSAAPTVDPATGNLSFTPASGATGNATISLELQNSGSTANGGVNTTVAQTFTITVAQATTPSFTPGPSQNISFGSGAQSVVNWATGISAGAGNPTRGLAFQVTSDSDTALFSSPPTISATTGTLSYTPAAGVSGTATIALDLGVGNSVSTVQTFTITVNPTGLGPSNTVPGPQNTLQTAPITFSTASGNAISVADPSLMSGGNIQVTVSVPVGTLALPSSASNISFTGNDSGTLLIAGQPSNVNAALNGIVYTPSLTFSGTTAIEVTSSDLGNNTTGQPLLNTSQIVVNSTGPFSQIGGLLTITGTSGNDLLTVYFSSATNLTATLNTASVVLNTASVSKIVFNGNGGLDEAIIDDQISKDSVTLSPEAMQFSGPNIGISLVNTQDIYYYGGSQSTAILQDSPGENTFATTSTYSYMGGNGYFDFVSGPANVYAYATSSSDSAYFYPGASDTFISTPTYAYLTNSTGVFFAAENFPEDYAFATAGNGSIAYLYLNANSTLVDSPTYAYATGKGYFDEAVAFTQSYGFAFDKSDAAYYYDSGGNEFVSSPTLSYLTGTGFFNAGENFALTVAYAGSASDAAYLYDSTSASDSFLGQATASYMVGASYESEAIGFQVVYAYSNGNGSATLDAAPGTNTLKATKNTATLTDPSGLISVEGFASVTATSNSGSDTQDLIGALDFYYDSIGTWTTNKS